MNQRDIYGAASQPPPPDAAQRLDSPAVGGSPPPPSATDAVDTNTGVTNAELGSAVAAVAVGWGANWLVGWLMFGLAFVAAIAAFGVVANVTQRFGLGASAFFAVFTFYYLRGTWTALQSESGELSDKLGSAYNIVLGSIAAMLAVACLFIGF